MRINIMFYDLDKNQEIDLTEKELLDNNPGLTIDYLIDNAHEIGNGGMLLSLKGEVKKVVQVEIKFEDHKREHREITFKFQDKDK